MFFSSYLMIITHPEKIIKTVSFVVPPSSAVRRRLQPIQTFSYPDVYDQLGGPEFGMISIPPLRYTEIYYPFTMNSDHMRFKVINQ